MAIFITTPDDEDSMFIRMVRQTDETGNQLTPLIWLGSSCEACEQKGLGSTCPHNWYEAPSHKSQERYERLKYIYKNHKTVDDQEQRARIQSRTRATFPPTLIESLFERPREPLPKSRRCVYLSADPACGGENEFALTAGYWDDSAFVVSLLWANHSVEEVVQF